MYRIYLSEFHGGGRAGGPDGERTYRTLRSAARALARIKRGVECNCGCYHLRAVDGTVVPIETVEAALAS